MLKKILSYLFPIRIYKAKSAISKTLEVTLYNGELVIDAENVNYSYGTLQRVLRFGLNKIGFENIRKMNSILILGVGGGSVIKTLVDEAKFKGTIKGVELDAEIIELANTYFQLNQISNLEVVIDDAQEFVRQENKTYDLIILDIFQDKNMPEFLFRTEFSSQLVNLLNPKGYILFNTMKVSDEDNQRNQKYILSYSDKNATTRVFSDIEDFNELIIVLKNN